MTVVEFTDDTDNKDATHVEVHDEWIVARIEGSNGNINRHCIPRERIKQVVGHRSGDDLTIES
jgi:hypothetical protein